MTESTQESFEWEEARTFLAIVDAGSLDGAARALGVHHSTVFRRLARLEAVLGAELFDRDGRRYRANAAGEAFEVHARQVQEQFFALQRAVLGSEWMPSGVLRLTTLEALLPFVLPALAALEAQCPELTVELDATTATRDLDRRDADMALRPSERPPQDAVGRRVAGMAWAVYGACGSGRAEQGRIDYVGPLAEMEGPRAAQVGATGDVRDLPPARLRARSVEAMAAAVGEGFGVGALPCYLGDRDRRLHRRGEPRLLPNSGLWLLMHPDLRDSARIRTLIDLLVPSLTPHVALFEGRTA